MRLFIAINFDEDTKRAMADAQDKLRGQTSDGRYTAIENMHLTLAFIGETPPSRVAEIKRAMEATTVPELTLTFDHAGRFRRQSGDIWWIGLDDNPGLKKLRRELLGQLAERGFHFDAGEFTPHVTLAREVETPGGVDAAKILPAPLSMTVSRISLMLSERVHGVLRYSELFYR